MGSKLDRWRCALGVLRLHRRGLLILLESAEHRHVDVDAGRVLDQRPDNHAVRCSAFDAEVLSALGRLQRAGSMSVRQVGTRLARLQSAPIQRHLLDGAWRRRQSLRLVDALYTQPRNDRRGGVRWLIAAM